MKTSLLGLTCTSRNKVMLKMMPPLLRYFWFHSIYSLAASCSLLSAVCGLQSAVSSLQSANVTHRKKKQGVWRLAAWLRFFCQKLGDRGHFVRTQCMDQHMMFYCPRETGHYCLRLLSCFVTRYWCNWRLF